jgi:hypothetical protein
MKIIILRNVTMKERMPQLQEEFDFRDNPEAVRRYRELQEGAPLTASKLIVENIDSELKAEERFTAIVDLMKELAEDPNNRFIIEAVSQQLSLEKKRHELQTLEEMYTLSV